MNWLAGLLVLDIAAMVVGAFAAWLAHRRPPARRRRTPPRVHRRQVGAAEVSWPLAVVVVACIAAAVVLGLKSDSLAADVVELLRWLVMSLVGGGVVDAVITRRRKKRS